MKKTYFLYLALVLSSASTLANSVLDFHLATAGEKSAVATYQLTQVKGDDRTLLEMQLTTSGDKTATAGHTIHSMPNTSSESVFDYHYTTTD
ncbi:hypothetical protein [Photobacterium satsumensis]|uniref:hypothetical protein n=1 Tax=Photobacterium satsumensis TaxID=2910239 RepID=UPI003D0CFADD